MSIYAELQVTTNFSFLTGGSHAEELVATAKALGLAAIAVTDRNTLAGVARAHLAARETGLRLIVGARLDLTDAPSLICLPTDRAAYGRLSRLLTLGQRRAGKGQCRLHLQDVAEHAEGQIFLALPPAGWDWREVAGAEDAPAQAALSGEVIRLPVRAAAGSRQQANGEGQQAAGSRQSAVGDGHTAGGSPLPAFRGERVRVRGGNGRDALDEAPVTTGAALAAAPHPSPLPVRAETRERGEGVACCTGSDLPTGGATPLPTADCRLPTADCPLPTPASFAADLHRLSAALAPAALYLAASHRYHGDDRVHIGALALLAEHCGTPLVATNDVLYHAPHRRPLQDVLTCIREKCTIAGAGRRLTVNAERHLKSADEMTRLFRGHEAALRRTIEIMQACRFSLDELVYEYPDEPVPAGRTPQSHLEDLTWEGAAWRYPEGIPAAIRQTLEKELALIAELSYAPYFLTVHDIVRFARSQDILCQGRGSAANSAVCYCLAITSVNPAEVDLLFERFISPERKEPPDIDVDFEHERREEVIQYIYARYGRERAGLAATVISYRARSAVREVGKVMGLSEDTVAALAGMVWGTRPIPGKGGGVLPEKHVREAGLDPADPRLARVLELSEEIMGFPRHLSQHVGGFVLTRGPLSEAVPIGNAAMAERTFIEWDKDDLDALGLLKVDVLGLGMLTCIRKAFAMIERHYGRRLTLGTVPREDPAVYDMLCRADSVGVFQVESRAQMNMLPRLKPRTFYDLVIEVAIVRPGPIQGDMVHPYLRRRAGIEPEDYPSPDPAHGPADELRQILGKTKGVPLFQEQAMRIAMVAARFSPQEANELRRAMATFRRRGTIHTLEEKMVSRMVARGYSPDFAQRCFNQIKGFGEYGFPESHAASFALLVYVSSWIKCHYPVVFAAALLNSQPMGFYAPAQIVRDAREHGAEVREADVNLSDWDSILEPDGKGGWAMRLGLRQIDGLKEEEAGKLMAVRGNAAIGNRQSAAGSGGTAVGSRQWGGDSGQGVVGRGQSAVGSAAAGWEVAAGAASNTLSPLARFSANGERAGVRGGHKRDALDEAPVTTGAALAAAPHPNPLPAKSGERRSAGRVPVSDCRLPTADCRSAAAADCRLPTAPSRFATIEALRQRAGVQIATLERLAAADAFRSLGLDRRQALWEVRALPAAPALPLFSWAEARETGPDAAVTLPEMALSEHVVNDYQTLRLSLKAHPMSFLRERLGAMRITACQDLRRLGNGARVAVAGVVLVRQRPGSAKGVVFMTIEDETGVANSVVWPDTLERYRKVVMGARLVLIRGTIQRHEDIIHVVSAQLEDQSGWLALLAEDAEPMKVPVANADAVLKPDPGSAHTPAEGHPRFARGHPRQARIVPKSRDFH